MRDVWGDTRASQLARWHQNGTMAKSWRDPVSPGRSLRLPPPTREDLPDEVLILVDLAVVPQDIAGTADWGSSDGSVVPVMVVDVEPAGKRSHTLAL